MKLRGFLLSYAVLLLFFSCSEQTSSDGCCECFNHSDSDLGVVPIESGLRGTKWVEPDTSRSLEFSSDGKMFEDIYIISFTKVNINYFGTTWFMEFCQPKGTYYNYMVHVNGDELKLDDSFRVYYKTSK